MDKYVKLSVGYYRDPKIAGLDDASEVMFTRALAYAGDARTAGLIPDAILGSLTRRPAAAHRIAERIACSGAWNRVDGGYQINRWPEWQDAIEELEQHRRKARERKARERARNTALASIPLADESSPNGIRPPVVTGLSRDRPVTVTDPYRNRELTAAAAALDLSRDELPPTVAILRTRMQAFVAFQSLRWDLTAGQLAAIAELITIHGDRRLVEEAIRTCRTPPPTMASAFIGTWTAMQPPGARNLRVVDSRCDVHHQAEPCNGCAADRLVGKANA